jgi:hypothetical protein
MMNEILFKTGRIFQVAKRSEETTSPETSRIRATGPVITCSLPGLVPECQLHFCPRVKIGIYRDFVGDGWR